MNKLLPKLAWHFWRYGMGIVGLSHVLYDISDVDSNPEPRNITPSWAHVMHSTESYRPKIYRPDMKHCYYIA